MTDLKFDIVIAGASLGGVAAALSAARAGASVALLGDTDWVGGQLTSQGVCTPDENQWVESGGCTLSYRRLRQEMRAHYREQYKLSSSGIAQGEFLSIGDCWVSVIAVEPKVARDILMRRIADLANLKFYPRTSVAAAERRINSITALIAEDSSGRETRFLASYFLDATDTGELFPLAGVEHSIGAESKTETGETFAPPVAHPEWIQPLTFPFALELRPEGETHTIPKPPRYEEMRELQRYSTRDEFRGTFGSMSWWEYRRVIAASNFDDDRLRCDVATINTQSNDFQGGIYPSGDFDADRRALDNGRLASLGYVYWLQTEAPHDDGRGRGYPNFKLRADWFDSLDGLALDPYIRESRRIKALRTVRDFEILKITQPGPRAVHFPDSCGIGHYHMDIHRGNTDEPRPDGFPEEWPNAWPFQIPLGALIPVTVTNLLPSCKNLGVTHLTNGAFRLHPIEWNVGESAGALAAFCAGRSVAPRNVQSDAVLLNQFQHELIRAGVPLYWWADLPADHPSFAGAQSLAMAGIWRGGGSLDFKPDDELTADEIRELEQSAGRPLELPAGMRRGDAAIQVNAALLQGE